MTDGTAPTTTPAMPAAGSGTGDLQQLIVLVSGVFHAAYTHVLPDFERETGLRVRNELSPSLGDSPLSVASRLTRSEDADGLDRAST